MKKNKDKGMQSPIKKETAIVRFSAAEYLTSEKRRRIYLTVRPFSVLFSFFRNCHLDCSVVVFEFGNPCVIQ